MKTETLAFAVPEDILASLRMGIKGLELDMRRLLALQYFKNKRLSLGKAARLAGMNRFDFMDYLGQEGVVLFDYDESMLAEESKGIKPLSPLAKKTVCLQKMNCM